MTLVLNGTTGVSSVDGSASTPAIQGADSNTGVFFPAADTVAIATGGTERVRTDSSGNVGFAVTPSTWSAGFKAIQISSVAALSAQTVSTELTCNAYHNSGWKYLTSNYATHYYQYNGGHYWEIAASGTAGNAITFTQAMTLGSDGNLLVGTTSNPNQGGHRLVLQHGAGARWDVGPSSSNTNNFYVLNAGGSGVYISGTGNSWTSFSDERLKTDLVPITNATEKVASLRAVTGRYLVDPEGTSRAFLIAQDVQKVLPEAVEASDPERLGVQYTDTIPLLVAAIKEQQALITSLTARVQALEAKQ